MGLEQVRELLNQARRLYARRRRHAQSADRLSAQEQAELLDTFGQLIGAADELLKEREQFDGRLRRTSIFTRPEFSPLEAFPPQPPPAAPSAPTSSEDEPSTPPINMGGGQPPTTASPNSTH